MTDLLIVGGGIMGLWAAVMAKRAGIETTLIERSTIGAGASGGFLGALMPHMPDSWNENKQFQFDALVSLEAEIAALESETGLSAGYRRCGRIMPLGKPHLRTIALRHEQEALENWRSADRAFSWGVHDGATVPDWPGASEIESGIVFDTLAARVAPRSLLSLLSSVLCKGKLVRILENADLARFDPIGGVAELAGGQVLHFGRCILAAGAQSFPLLDALHPERTLPSGTAVKGQAALFNADIDPLLPVIYSDGVYIVAHEDGKVAVGSTSEDVFEDAFGCDHRLDLILERARTIAPRLRDAEVVQRWAGLRPKAVGRDPMVGQHPDFERLFMLTGGFKVSFGLAHRLAEAVVAEIAERPGPALPKSFQCAAHIALIRP